MDRPIPDLYGPNKEAVAAILDRAARMTPDEMLRAATYMNHRMTDAWADAQEAEADAFEESGRMGAWEAIWDAADRATRASADSGDWSEVKAEVMGETDPSPEDIREAVLAEACGTTAAAALAAVVKDRISEEHYRVLTAPWREADLDAADHATEK
jgi:hypothetical protein